MDDEFHYYITGIIAQQAGFDEQEARIIACSSQFVDDNDVILQVEDRETHEIYSNYISQTMDILKPRKTLMRIYPIFHFVPGDPTCETAYRNDGKMHVLNTTPDCELANQMLSNAFKSPPDIRPYRIGIATHAYVDTWAHQNFAGFRDSFNGDILNPVPNIGHAEAGKHPDWVGHRWEDDRLVACTVDNNLRFMSAARRLFEKYTDHLRSTARWDDLQPNLLTAMGPCRSGNGSQGREAREAAYKQLSGGWGPFDEADWFEAAIDHEIHGLEDSEKGIMSRVTLFKDRYWWKQGQTKEETHWYRFQEAVKAHQAEALGPINERFQTMGVNIRLL